MSGKSGKRATKVRRVIAESLKSQGVEYVFGIVGYPIIELGIACQRAGLKYIGCRNEQSASYAAAAVGYLTGRPGCCLVVPGPGVIHALAGMANASANGWPMICVAGASELAQNGLGAFQESLPPQGGSQIQVQYPAAGICKYVVKATNGDRVPFFIEQAVRYSIQGRPGAVYVEVAGDTLRQPTDPQIYYPPRCADPALTFADPKAILKALKILGNAKKPLLICGKGAAYADASNELRHFVESTNIPFLPTPMGKGVIPDDHSLCMSSARSYALKNADIILLVGARLNWILHYGRPPRYRRDTKFIHVELLPEEVGHSRPAEVALVGHAKAVMQQLNSGLKENPIAVDKRSEWINELEKTRRKSRDLFLELSTDRSSPMNYYCALSIIDRYIPHDAIIMNEGSDTMDIGRTVLNNYHPKSRLDAGTWGTMGVGMGQALAASLVNPGGCVAVFGDSAFGFSGMEIEVAIRLNLPLVVIIINNNGIGAFNPTEYTSWDGKKLGNSTDERLQYSVKSLSPQAHYEGFATALGAKGVYVDTADALESAVKEAMSVRPFKPQIINCMISTVASRGKKAAPPFAAVGKL